MLSDLGDPTAREILLHVQHKIDQLTEEPISKKLKWMYLGVLIGFSAGLIVGVIVGYFLQAGM